MRRMGFVLFPPSRCAMIPVVFAFYLLFVHFFSLVYVRHDLVEIAIQYLNWDIPTGIINRVR